MSYDFEMFIDTGGQELRALAGYDNLNYTYNVSPMFCKAFGPNGIHVLAEQKGKKCIPKIIKAIKDMKKNSKAYKELNPANGWGCYEGALVTLKTLLKWCVENPKATLVIQ